MVQNCRFLYKKNFKKNLCGDLYLANIARMQRPEGDLHCQCILSIFPASVHQFYGNILVFVNINPFLYINDQFALHIVNFPCRLVPIMKQTHLHLKMLTYSSIWLIHLRLVIFNYNGKILSAIFLIARWKLHMPLFTQW